MEKRIFSNASCNLILQLSIIASGFILPKYIISRYGSSVNGLIVSINQFLSYITLLESGIGGVIKSQLYRPLYDNNAEELSGIINAANTFFKKIGCIFFIYMLVVASCFKFISDSEFDWMYIFSLVLILGISTLIQYFVGITYQVVIQADQHYSFTSSVQTITIWMNVVFSIVCMDVGYPIHIVKLVTGILFAIRPICYLVYAKKHYKIDSSIPDNKKALSQRWDGFGHHIAYFIHSNTDIILLTFFISLKEVSVYSVYLMVVTGVRSLISAVSNAVEPFFGRVIASGDKHKLKSCFDLYESFHFLLSSVLFGATMVLIVPFVRIYMNGVTDVDYIRVPFSILIVLSELMYSLRTPYSIIVFAAGHFKQTKRGAYVEALLNIALSLILIKPLGLVGVSIGTLVAMVFRTTEYAFYLSENILNKKVCSYFKKLVTSVVSIGILFSIFRELTPVSYWTWIVYAFGVVICSSLIAVGMFAIFDLKDFKNMLVFVKQRG